jgi:hypothetical protein
MKVKILEWCKALTQYKCSKLKTLPVPIVDSLVLQVNGKVVWCFRERRVKQKPLSLHLVYNDETEGLENSDFMNNDAEALQYIKALPPRALLDGLLVNNDVAVLLRDRGLI